MLDRFLKFIKNASDEPDFEGSYLDHLLDEVRPRVETEMAACPAHDPLLVVIAEALRQTLPDEWDDELSCPVADDLSPPLAAPEPPPVEPTDAGGDDKNQEAPADDGGAKTEAVDPDDEDLEILETAELELSDDEIAELDEAAARAERPALDSPPMLQAGRMFLGLLIENDRLPLQMQLTVAELMLARDVLLGYFIEGEQFEDTAEQLLALIEQKFNDGAFFQARILLQLFQTDPQTRVNNDRNLFHQDMFMKLSVRPQGLFGASRADDPPDVDASDDLDTAVADTCTWLADTRKIQCHVFTRDPERVDIWRAIADRSRREEADEVLLRYLPPKRWRPVGASSRPPTARLREHVCEETARRYVLRQLKACYFVLRAGGDTGMEPFLDDFFDWTERAFDCDTVRLLPLLHQRSTSETDLLDEIFDEIYESFFAGPVHDRTEALDDEAIEAAAEGALETLHSTDLDELPEGHYDLGGLLYDELFEMAYFEPEFGLTLHRLA